VNQFLAQEFIYLQNKEDGMNEQTFKINYFS
jgi:hypothetical protein